MNISFKQLNEHAITPTYGTEFSAGLDLFACIERQIVIHPGDRELIPIGIPRGHWAGIYSRSGLAFKNGVHVMNAPGVLDSDYRGPVSVLLVNHGIYQHTITRGSRIAQLIIHKYEKITPVLVTELDDTDRGVGGFGSTGG